MEVPVAVVVQIVDAGRHAPLLVDAPGEAYVGGEVLRERLVRKAVRIAVVQRAELRAAVARAEGRVEPLGRPPRGEQARAPARHARLPLADGVAGRAHVR